MKLTTEPLANQYQKEQLLNNLYRIFGVFDTTMLTLLEPLLEWVEIGGGELLFRQHDTGDSLYFVISGRLQAFITDDQGHRQIIGEIIRGETVGEMAIFTGDPRSATIIALRDSVLVKLSKNAFEQVIAAYPAVSMNVTKLIINRLRTSQGGRQPPKKPVNICLLALHENPIRPDNEATAFAEDLYPLLNRKGKVCVVSSQTVDDYFGQSDFAQVSKSDPSAYRELTQWLDDQESQHEFMLYVTDPVLPVYALTEWTRRCLRQGDEILLLADAQQEPILTPVEQRYLMDSFQTGAPQTLILVHPANTAHPKDTCRWLALRPGVKKHYHIRTGLSRDMTRLARILSGTAVGFVLAGGGAKGFAHIGVLKALQEWGIPVDVVGGTSVGGLVAPRSRSMNPSIWS